MRVPSPGGAPDSDLDSAELLTRIQGSSLPDTPQVEEVLWEDEDEPEMNLANPKEASPAPVFGSSSVRKRKSTGRKVFLAQSSGTPRKYSELKKKGNGNIREDIPPLVNIDQVRLRRGFHDSAAFTWDYASDVLGTALHLLRKPLGALLFLYLLALVLTYVSSAFRKAFAPVCWFPVISRSPLCYTPAAAPNVPKWADYPKLVEVESSTFEKLLDESVGNAGLSLDIVKAEMATNDMIALLKASNLKSKESLAEHLKTFIDDSQKTGKVLKRLSSRVSGAVDSITATNEHALKTIGEAQAAKSSLSLTGLILWPVSKGVAMRTVVADTFANAMSVLETHVARIRVEAEAAAILLSNLEQSLITLHEMLARENITLTHEKDELLAELWTKLGGNRKKLHGVNGHLWLVDRIGDWRKRAQVHVFATLHALDTMSEDMEELRERVAQPELIGEKVPPEVHMKSIQAGLDRLKMDREHAKEQQEESIRRILSLDGLEE